MKKTDVIFFVVLYGYLLSAIIIAGLTAEVFGFHSFSGLYDMWRAQISLMLGLILSRYISHKHKEVFFTGLVLFLKLNLVFSLLQAASGGFLVESMIALNEFGDTLEYRSGIVRTVGFFTNANTNAWFIAFYLYFAVSQIKVNRIWIVLSLIALLTTGSRSVLFVSLMIILFQSLSANHYSVFRFLRKNIQYILLVVAVALLFSSFNGKSSSIGYSLIPDLEVITTVKESKVEDSYFRAFALKTCMDRFFESPLVGWGPGNYGTPSSFRSHSKYLSEDGYDHFIDLGMTQLDMLIPLLLPETGIIGFIMWVFLMFFILKEVRRKSNDSPESRAVQLWCVLLIISAFVGPGITHPLIVAILPIIVACSISKAVGLTSIHDINMKHFRRKYD